MRDKVDETAWVQIGEFQECELAAGESARAIYRIEKGSHVGTLLRHDIGCIEGRARIVTSNWITSPDLMVPAGHLRVRSARFWAVVAWSGCVGIWLHAVITVLVRWAFAP